MQPNKFLTLPRVLIIAFLAVLITGIITFSISQDWWKTLIATALVAVYLLIIIWISKSIWLPEGRGKFIVRLATVGLALTTIGFYMGWQEVIQDLLANYLNIPNLGEAVHPLIVFSFSVLVIWIINFFNRDNTGMGIHPESLDKDIPERDFNERLESVCKSLVDDLRSIDIKTNWSVHNFVPLEAEVELQTDNGLKKKVTDLLKAIKSSKDRLFLVLGDPGSGKSVALRKLCQDLAKEVKKTKKIPIYINLKEWQIEEKWSEENPPTIEQLNEFVLNNIRNRDIVVKRFFDKYYDRLYENGHLYFVFDSFDEIPAVLDEKDSSPLIKQLSEIIFKFLKGARADSSQGILSSRIFRKPTQEFQARTRLEIRPFSDEKIETTLRRSAKFDESLIRKLFKDRTDLIPVARNPFMASLIADYVDNNQNQLPKNQSDLYESYIDNALKDCQDRMDKRGITSEDVKACAIEMADVMFREYGLEAPINILKTKLDNQHVEAVIDVLKFARIGRVGSGDENIFSFAHRRFCEYFAVQKLIEDDRELDLNAIPTDSQWRDALVLYCEVANEEKATAIANFCWNIIRLFGDLKNPYSIHCFRFLKDAFQIRPECIAHFRTNLAEFINDQVTESEEILSIKLSLEATGLLSQEEINHISINALHYNNDWIRETCIRSCRSLSDISLKLEKMLINFLSQMTVYELLVQYKKYSFSFHLSEAFRHVNSFLYHRTVYFSICVVCAIFLTILYPFPGFFAFMATMPFGFLFENTALRNIFNEDKSFTVFTAFWPISFLMVSFFFFIIPESEFVNPFYFSAEKEAITFDNKLLLLVTFIPFYKKYYKGIHSIKSFLNVIFFPFVQLLTGILMSPFVFINLITDLFKDRRAAFTLIIAFMLIAISVWGVTKIESVIDEANLTFIMLAFSALLSPIFFIYRTLIQNREYNIGISKVSFKMDRKDIYEALNNMRFKSSKLKYLAYLDQKTKFVNGEYPDNKFLRIYNFDNEVNTKLAKLEEKWLGLNR